ncbi:MAG: FAD-dependent oxidoreductase [Dehalococcoidia bacterium]|nr:FAD-dependent oxidoreductase [Dehalococcoidia bacterium]
MRRRCYRGRSVWRAARDEEPRPDIDGAWRTFARFRELMPSVDGLGVERIWSGYIDYTPDAVPVIDRPGPRGLVVATGFSGHGFALGPIGALLASQLAAGDEPEVDVHPFRLARFAEGDLASDELHF